MTLEQQIQDYEAKLVELREQLEMYARPLTWQQIREVFEELQEVTRNLSARIRKLENFASRANHGIADHAGIVEELPL